MPVGRFVFISSLRISDSSKRRSSYLSDGARRVGIQPEAHAVCAPTHLCEGGQPETIANHHLFARVLFIIYDK